MQVWGAKDVFYDNLNACKQVGNVILGFHEPDLSSGASMSVQVSSPASHYAVDRHRTKRPCRTSSRHSRLLSLECGNCEALWDAPQRLLTQVL